MDAALQKSSPETGWSVELMPGAAAAVAAFELLLEPNARRIQRLTESRRCGTILLGCGQGASFRLFWEDAERVHSVRGETFAAACSALEERLGNADVHRGRAAAIR